MLDKMKNRLDDSALSEISGGAEKGIDEEATHTIQIPCYNPPKCTGGPQIYDVYSGRRAYCRNCGKEIVV